MVIPSRSTLVAQLHCLSDSGAVVITAQRWEDQASTIEAPIAWLRLVRNGRAQQDQRFTGAGELAEMEVFWAGLAKRYAPSGLTDDQMWSALRELTGAEQARCADATCPGALPSGGSFCLECGRSADAGLEEREPTDWDDYRMCTICRAHSGDPCTARSSRIYAGRAEGDPVELDVPHGGRVRRRGK